MSQDESGGFRRCVVLGGSGAVGSMLARFFRERGADVCIVDVDPPGGDLIASGARFQQGDATVPTAAVLQELRRADVVVLALPEPVAVAAAAPITAALSATALLVETGSVKSPIAAAIGAVTRPVTAVGLNPMFAPALGMAGRSIAVVVLSDGPRITDLLDLLTATGSRLVPVKVDEHDRICAATQVLTHAAVLVFGLALAKLDVGAARLNALATPPHATLLALLARIASGTPAVYWEIQSENRHGDRARAALGAALDELTGVVRSGDSGGFETLLRQVRDFLGADLPRNRALCARMFEMTAEGDPDPQRM